MTTRRDMGKNPILQMVSYLSLNEGGHTFCWGKCYAGTGEDQRALEALTSFAAQSQLQKRRIISSTGSMSRLVIRRTDKNPNKNAAQTADFEELLRKRTNSTTRKNTAKANQSRNQDD